MKTHSIILAAATLLISGGIASAQQQQYNNTTGQKEKYNITPATPGLSTERPVVFTKPDTNSPPTTGRAPDASTSGAGVGAKTPGATSDNLVPVTRGGITQD
jgi:hypothetical protein